MTNGTVQLNNIYDKFQLSSQLAIDQFSFNNELIGLTNTSIGFIQSTGMVPFEIKAPNIGYNLSAKGSYNIKDSLNPLYRDWETLSLLQASSLRTTAQSTGS